MDKKLRVSIEAELQRISDEVDLVTEHFTDFQASLVGRRPSDQDRAQLKGFLEVITSLEAEQSGWKQCLDTGVLPAATEGLGALLQQGELRPGQLTADQNGERMLLPLPLDQLPRRESLGSSKAKKSVISYTFSPVAKL